MLAYILEVHILLFLKFSVVLTQLIYVFCSHNLKVVIKVSFSNKSHILWLHFSFMCIILEIVLNFCCFSYNASFSLGPPWLVHLIWSLIMHYVSHSWCSFYSSWSWIKIANVDIKFAASLHIDYPMLFELRNAAAERVSHCGVLEFIAEEGMIYMPYWVGIQIFFGLGTSTAICYKEV